MSSTSSSYVRNSSAAIACLRGDELCKNGLAPQTILITEATQVRQKLYMCYRQKRERETVARDSVTKGKRKEKGEIQENKRLKEKGRGVGNEKNDYNLRTMTMF